jgi:hypothetical protein
MKKMKFPDLLANLNNLNNDSIENGKLLSSWLKDENNKKLLSGFTFESLITMAQDLRDRQIREMILSSWIKDATVDLKALPDISNTCHELYSDEKLLTSWLANSKNLASLQAVNIEDLPSTLKGFNSISAKAKLFESWTAKNDNQTFLQSLNEASREKFLKTVGSDEFDTDEYRKIITKILSETSKTSEPNTSPIKLEKLGAIGSPTKLSGEQGTNNFRNK